MDRTKRKRGSEIPPHAEMVKATMKDIRTLSMAKSIRSLVRIAHRQGFGRIDQNNPNAKWADLDMHPRFWNIIRNFGYMSSNIAGAGMMGLWDQRNSFEQNRIKMMGNMMTCHSCLAVWKLWQGWWDMGAVTYEEAMGHANRQQNAWKDYDEANEFLAGKTPTVDYPHGLTKKTHHGEQMSFMDFVGYTIPHFAAAAFDELDARHESTHNIQHIIDPVANPARTNTDMWNDMLFQSARLAYRFIPNNNDPVGRWLPNIGTIYNLMEAQVHANPAWLWTAAAIPALGYELLYNIYRYSSTEASRVWHNTHMDRIVDYVVRQRALEAQPRPALLPIPYNAPRQPEQMNYKGAFESAWVAQRGAEVGEAILNRLTISASRRIAAGEEAWEELWASYSRFSNWYVMATAVNLLVSDPEAAMNHHKNYTIPKMYNIREFLQSVSKQDPDLSATQKEEEEEEEEELAMGELGMREEEEEEEEEEL